MSQVSLITLKLGFISYPLTSEVRHSFPNIYDEETSSTKVFQRPAVAKRSCTRVPSPPSQLMVISAHIHLIIKNPQYKNRHIRLIGDSKLSLGVSEWWVCPVQGVFLPFTR